MAARPHLDGNQVLQELLAGNERFRTGRTIARKYEQGDLARIAQVQEPIAAVVACADSRVAPEVIFDQPLGAIFASRVPGNVASDSAKWMIDIAVSEFRVPLLLVLGHTGCLAVGQVVKGQTGGVGGPLRLNVLKAVYRAERLKPADLWREAIIQNCHHTIEQLAEESQALRSAMSAKRIVCAAALYEMETGEVLLLNPPR